MTSTYVSVSFLQSSNSWILPAHHSCSLSSVSKQRQPSLRNSLILSCTLAIVCRQPLATMIRHGSYVASRRPSTKMVRHYRLSCIRMEKDGIIRSGQKERNWSLSMSLAGPRAMIRTRKFFRLKINCACVPLRNGGVFALYLMCFVSWLGRCYRAKVLILVWYNCL